ncbi:oxygenase MpaB family protein [Streptomyces sp. NBC_00239]|uniref:oxygenase MpaB family protein n=1 Tax=Streptomyces sp. NBC_00239 TaxID=2903640 RepID=UPI002E2AF2AB|nr:oxygenase MpaB family protein [Streptomyces sp. NBC_00239]
MATVPEGRAPSAPTPDGPPQPSARADAPTPGEPPQADATDFEHVLGPGSRFHTLFDDPRWALALIRATVLEAAHPQVGAALLDNSTFVTHPWRRLRNTLLSLQRIFGTSDDVRRREAARLNRLHGRLHGTDSRERPYHAMDPEARAWVVATLFDSVVTMHRLSGQPLAQEAMEQLYGEFHAFLAVLGDHAGHLPDSLQGFWQYYDRVVEEELENTEAARIILYKLFDHLPAPPLLTGVPALWAAGRALGGPVVGAITVASLPESFRRRAALPELPGAQTLMQGAYVAAGLARFLPAGWLSADGIMALLDMSPQSDDPRARTVTALQHRIKRAAALLRLLNPLPDPVPEPEDGPGAYTAGGAYAGAGAGSGAGVRRASETFFREVLDQTGDGYLDWPDLAAMARELSTRLDLDEPEETRLYNAYADWWRELQRALDTDGDGRVSAREYAAAAPSLAGPALIRVAEVLFDATDKDGNQSIDADEYRTLFRTAFRRDTAASAAAYSRSAFVGDFLAFMSARHRSTPFDPLLADA